MKKTYIIIAAMLMLTLTGIKAQFKYGPRISLGATSLGEGNSSIGAQLGLLINAELKDRIGVQGEVLYSLKTGYKDQMFDNASGSKTTVRTRYTFTYIDIPIYGYFPLSDHLTCLLGPQLGIVNKGKSVSTGSGASVEETITGAKAKLGFAGGIDVNLKSPFRFGLRFSTNGGEPLAGKSSFIGVTAAYLLKW